VQNRYFWYRQDFGCKAVQDENKAKVAELIRVQAAAAKP
jgi:hypothetical protein